jgi:hypothetical protein
VDASKFLCQLPRNHSFGAFGPQSVTKCSTRFLRAGRRQDGKKSADPSKAGSQTPSVFPETLNREVKIRIQSVATRPFFMVEQLEHPIAVEQQAGIPEARARKMAALLLHQERFGWPAEFT